MSNKNSGKKASRDGQTFVSRKQIYNANHLCINEETLNTKILTTYDATFPFLPCRIDTYIDDTLTAFIEWEYTQQGQIQKSNQSGSVTLFEYDNHNFPIKKIECTGTDDPDVVTFYRYNEQGQCVDLITHDAVQHYDYDIMGNQLCSILSLSSGKILSKTYAGYDFNNELIWMQGDEDNDTVFLDYNAAGLLKASRKNLTQIHGEKIIPVGVAYTLYEYDACGALIEKIDPLGNCTYCNVDGLGRVINSTIDGLTSSYTYESGGQLASTTTPSGATTSRLYTCNGLLKSEIYPDGTYVSIIYDLLGRPIQEDKNGIVATIVYSDVKGVVTRFEAGFSEIQQYDPRGNLLSSTDKAGYTWFKTYDALNRIKSETSPDGEITTWQYQQDTIVCTFPNGERTIQRYEAGKIVESQTIASDGTLITKCNFLNHREASKTEIIQDDILMTTWTNTLGNPIRIQQGEKITKHYLRSFWKLCDNCRW